MRPDNSRANKTGQLEKLTTLGLEFQDERVHSGFLTMLAIITLLAAAVVLSHGLRRWKHRDEAGDHGFLIRITAGDDAVAALAILWQLFPLFMLPVCT